MQGCSDPHQRNFEQQTSAAHALKCIRTLSVNGNKMVFSCVVPRCTNRQSSTNGISFFRFPKNRKKRRAWIKAVNRDKWEPTEYSRICSEHFEEGWHSEDREDVNYRPTIFKCKQEDRSADKLGRESQVSHSLIQVYERWRSTSRALCLSFYSCLY